MIIREGETVRLGFSPLVRWRRSGPVVILGVVGIGVGIVGLTELSATSSAVTMLGKVAFAVFGVISLALGTWLIRLGVRAGRQASARLPVLEATPDTIRLTRANRKAREVPRGKVVAASFEVLPAEHERAEALSYLEWFDDARRSLGVWTLDPKLRRPLARWLRAIGVERTADRSG